MYVYMYIMKTWSLYSTNTFLEFYPWESRNETKSLPVNASIDNELHAKCNFATYCQLCRGRISFPFSGFSVSVFFTTL